jgi:tetratricopeptide (TPR) repeat protein
MDDSSLAEASLVFGRAQTILEQLIASNPESAYLRHNLGLTLLNVAEAQRRHGSTDKATFALKHAVEIESQLAIKVPESLDYWITLAKAYSQLGRLLRGQPDEMLAATIAYERAIEFQECITREHPELPEEAFLLASNLRQLSSLQREANQPDIAFENLNRAVTILDRISQSYPAVIPYQEDLGTSYSSMYEIQRQRGEQAGALAAAESASKLFEHLVSRNLNDPRYQRSLAQSQTNLVRAFLQVGSLKEAQRSLQRAIDLLESVSAPDIQESYDLARNLALCIPLIGSTNSRSQFGNSLNEHSKADQHRQQLYGDRAIESLKRAIRHGSLDSQTLQNDADLNAL